MATHKLLLLPGDGIGPEVMGEVKRLIEWLNAAGIAHFETEQGLVGGAAYDASKQSITDATMARAMAADAVIFGAVGGPKWDSVPYEARPEAGLLRLRKELGLFANLRPAVCYPALADASSLKREVVGQVHAREYKDVQLEHQLADSGGMNLVKWPKAFDVIVTDNLFGDMLSDIAAMLTGSLGMLPSASLGEIDVKTRKRRALYEPVHGSAPDIAGKGLANPIAMIASFGMALRYSFDMGALADKLDAAIAAVLARGLRTADIKAEGTTAVSTTQMGEAILKELQALH